MTGVEFFEAVMLVCFGCSWPVAIAKTLRVRRVHGKSVGFLFLVTLGYLSGIVAKILDADGGIPSWVTALYALNACMVSTEIVLYFRFKEPETAGGAALEAEPPAGEVVDPGGSAEDA
mgnify:CR=1 FL=1